MPLSNKAEREEGGVERIIRPKLCRMRLYPDKANENKQCFGDASVRARSPVLAPLRRSKGPGVLGGEKGEGVEEKVWFQDLG